MAEDIPGNPDKIAPFGRDDMTNRDLPGNSYANRKPKAKKEAADKPKVTNKVVKGEVIQRKKGLGHKVAETFAGDDARSVGSYILFDVVIPATKNLLADAASQGVERLLFGDSRGRSRVTGRNGTHPSYGSIYKRNQEGRREMSTRGRSTHDFDEIIIESRGEAEEVLDQLMILVEDYGHAKISDFYALVGITGSYVDDKWGWMDLRAASTTRVRQGYILDLPLPVVIE